MNDYISKLKKNESCIKDTTKKKAEGKKNSMKA